MIINDVDLVHLILSVLKGKASRWYRTIRRDSDKWKAFFCREFLTTVDDVVDKLRARIQAREEKISSYVTSLKLIMGHLTL